MFVVHHYNYGITRQFDALDLARDFVIRAHFEAVIYHQGAIVARFSPIGGWR